MYEIEKIVYVFEKNRGRNTRKRISTFKTPRQGGLVR